MYKPLAGGGQWKETRQYLRARSALTHHILTDSLNDFQLGSDTAFPEAIGDVFVAETVVLERGCSGGDVSDIRRVVRSNGRLPGLVAEH